MDLTEAAGDVAEDSQSNRALTTLTEISPDLLTEVVGDDGALGDRSVLAGHEDELGTRGDLRRVAVAGRTGS